MKLVHPHSKQEIEVGDSRVAHYVSQGWHQLAGDAPKASASLSAWREYARTKGFSDDDLKGMKRDEIRAALA